MHDVDISQDLAPRHHAVLRELHLLSLGVDSREWCLVGGLMVLVAGRAVGFRSDRSEATKDGDIVVDVCADRGALSKVATNLKSHGFVIPEDAWEHPDIARCTFASGYAQIDVLCPDDADDESLLADDRVRSIAIPGGRRALELAEAVRLFYDESAFDVEIRVPLLPGALLVKAAAVIDPRTRDHPRHIQDVAFLLAAIDDPHDAARRLAATDVKLLNLLPAEFDKWGTKAWQFLDARARSRAEAALRFLRR